VRCPACHQSADVVRVCYSELGPDNTLVPCEQAKLSCGCLVPLADVPAVQDHEWERRARSRADEIFRQIFS
jgi:hypothetical protein